ncbi:MAG: WecB/TagA/CpsF family glycosyltransferase [Candidatus Omnitrophota bacterium]
MNVLGIKYNNLEFNDSIKQALSIVNDSKKSNLFFINTDCLYKAQKDKEYRDIINTTSLVLPDGIGLKLVTMLFGGRMKANCNGTDLCPVLLERAAEKGYKIYFLGSKEGIAEKAAENVRKLINEIKIVGTNHGYIKKDTEAIKTINESGADILFVAMGVPLQEKWIVRNRNRINVKLCVGVGALFDYLSGNKPRAPIIMRKMHLEWFWRIFIEPRRMFKRYIIDGFKLLGIIMKNIVLGYK